eukprot:6628221-Pyramimonas_sp.AAC.1
MRRRRTRRLSTLSILGTARCKKLYSFRASGFEGLFPFLGLISPLFLVPGSSTGGVVLGLCLQA